MQKAKEKEEDEQVRWSVTTVIEEHNRGVDKL